MTIAISGTNGITLDGQFNSASSMGFKNRIINGAMVIDQRNAGASVTISADSTYTLDRWIARTDSTAASKYSVQQNAGSVTPPDGLTNYLGVTSLSSYSSVSTNYYWLAQFIEGFNVADLGFGTANAKTVTLSFWVRSSLTGTFSGSLVNGNYNRSYAFTFSIPSANTWTQISVTVAGDTSGTWLTTNGLGLQVRFNLGSGSNNLTTANSWQAGNFAGVTGSVSVVGTNGATFYITGVQLEKGSTATSFDYRPYGTELALCQRYFQPVGNGASGRTASATNIEIVGNFVNSFRAAPTLTFGGFSGANTTIGQFSVGNVTATAISSYLSNANSGFYIAITVSGATSGSIAGIVSGDVCSASAEL